MNIETVGTQLVNLAHAGMADSQLICPATLERISELLRHEEIVRSIPRRELRLLRAVVLEKIELPELAAQLELAEISTHHLRSNAVTALGKQLENRALAKAVIDHFLEPNFRLSDSERESLVAGELSGFFEGVLEGSRNTPLLVAPKNLRILQHYYGAGDLVREAGAREGVGVPTAENRRKYGLLQLAHWLSCYGISAVQIEAVLSQIRDSARSKQTQLSAREVIALTNEAGLGKFLLDSLQNDGAKLYPKNRFSHPLKLYYVEGRSFKEVSERSGISVESANAVVREGVLHIVRTLAGYGAAPILVRRALLNIRHASASKKVLEFSLALRRARSAAAESVKLPEPLEVNLGKYSRTASAEVVFKQLGIERPHNIDAVKLTPFAREDSLFLKLEGPPGFLRIIKLPSDKHSSAKTVHGSGNYRRYRMIDPAEDLREHLQRDIVGGAGAFELESICDELKRSPLRGFRYIKTNFVPICWEPLTHSEEYRWRLYQSCITLGIHSELQAAVLDGARFIATPERILFELKAKDHGRKLLKACDVLLELDPEELSRRLCALPERFSREFRSYRVYADEVAARVNSFCLLGISNIHQAHQLVLNLQHVESLLRAAAHEKPSRNCALIELAELAPHELMFTLSALKRVCKGGNRRAEILRGFASLDQELSGNLSARAMRLCKDYRKLKLNRGAPFKRPEP